MTGGKAEWVLREAERDGLGEKACQVEAAASEAPACGPEMWKTRLERARSWGVLKAKLKLVLPSMEMRERSDLHGEAGSMGQKFHTPSKCVGSSGAAAATDYLTQGTGLQTPAPSQGAGWGEGPSPSFD